MPTKKLLKAGPFSAMFLMLLVADAGRAELQLSSLQLNSVTAAGVSAHAMANARGDSTVTRTHTNAFTTILGDEQPSAQQMRSYQGEDPARGRVSRLSLTILKDLTFDRMQIPTLVRTNRPQ